jgi:hypothetical protein
MFSFSGFFPVAVNFLRRVPILGTVLNFPGIRGVSFSNEYFESLSATDIYIYIYIYNYKCNALLIFLIIQKPYVS